jgi:hypothetical protein
MTMTSPSEKPVTPSRRERIVVLLEWYVDVEAQGLRDGRGDGDHLPLMSRAWNHPSYRELDRLLGVMRDHRRHLYWHLSQTYFYAAKRQVLQCPRCRGVMPAWHTANFHKHGHSNVAVVPRVVRVRRPEVRDAHVDEAVTWLEQQWSGELFLPDELMVAA